MNYTEKLIYELNNLHLGANNRVLNESEQIAKKEWLENRLSWLSIPSLLIDTINKHQKPRRLGAPR